MLQGRVVSVSRLILLTGWLSLLCVVASVRAEELSELVALDAAPLLSERKQPVDLSLAVGPMVKGAKGWLPEHSLKLAGSFERVIYRVADSQASQVWGALHLQLLKAGARELFRCEGNACGSNRAWALGQFQSSLLVGRNVYQRYSALVVGEDQFFAFYLTRPAAKPAGGYRLLVLRLSSFTSAKR